MKYLKREIYANSFNNISEWNRQYNAWRVEFEKIAFELPENFISEFNKSEFHDYIVKSLKIKYLLTSEGKIYNLIMKLFCESEKNIEHILTFEDVSKYSFEATFENAGYVDWIYSEILKVGKERFSLEVCLFDIEQKPMYVEFKRIKYERKIKTNKL